MIAPPASSENATTAALQRALAERDVLLREIHHRLKNDLQVVSSLVHLQEGRFSDPRVKEAFREVQQRVRAMALLHETVYRAPDVARADPRAYLASVCHDAFRAYGVDEARVELVLRIEEKTLDVDAMMTLGLIATELVANSLKHAFPDDRRGRVTVELSTRADGASELRVVDDGVGIAPPTASPGPPTLGLEIVRSLAARLSGAVVQTGEAGTETVVGFRARPTTEEP